MKRDCVSADTSLVLLSAAFSCGGAVAHSWESLAGRQRSPSIHSLGVMSTAKPLAVPAARTWNMCMLAHVDHGKSALSDALVASNGHISVRTAGHVRYMDSRADEQRRGITMKSSSIALGARNEKGDLQIINLVDSPGHVDFSGEVEAALRVCDGCLVVVDVVEGVCVQTVAVLKAALESGVVPCLVLNKVDRLFCELHLGVDEAYWRILRVLEQVNVVMGVREVEDMMARADIGYEDGGEWEVEDDVGDDGSSGYFSPEKGNVVFASATDGWAFRIQDFASIFAKKFGISERVLRKTLWGDYVLMAKTKKIVRKSRRAKATDNRKVMFVQMVLTSLHSVYDSIMSTANDLDLAIEKRTKIVEKLGLSLTNRDLKHKDATVALRAIMSTWLPAASALLGAITSKLPTAAVAQRDQSRLGVLWPHMTEMFEPESSGALQKKSVEGALSDDHAPALAFVTKMIEPVGKDSASGGKMNIRMPKPRDESTVTDGGESKSLDQSGEILDDKDNSPGLVAFARILSGTLTVGDTVFVYGPRYFVRPDGSFDATTVSEGKIEALYLLMGRDMDTVSMATAGSIVGIAGLSDVVLKTATVSSLPPGSCLSLCSSGRTAALGASRDAVVRVAVEPHLPGDVPALQKGLRKLNQADPAVDTYVSSNGEHVIAASGELHLERCLLDLRERFAPGIKIHISPPIISFLETVVGGISAPPLRDLQDGFKLAASSASFVPLSSGKKETTSESIDDTEASSILSLVLEGVDTPVDNNYTSPNGRTTGPSRPWGVVVEGTDEYEIVMGKSSTSVAWKELDGHLLQRGRFVIVGNDAFSYRLCGAAVPANLATVLDEAGAIVRESSLSGKADESPLSADATEKLRERLHHAIEQDAEDGGLRAGLKKDFVDFWGEKVFRNLLSCGPRRFGSNLLVGPQRSGSLPIWLEDLLCSQSEESRTANSSAQNALLPKELENAIITGFQLGVQSGPLCEEPIHGFALFVDEIKQSESTLPSSLAGLAIGSTKEAVRLAFLNASPRVMEASLDVDVSVSADALGRMYTVLAKRRGRVLLEDMKDGVNIFNVTAVIPLTESFGFAEALRKQTSGFASAQMTFRRWEAVDVDPFWVPKTEEEKEDIAAEDATETNNNLARKLLTGVRRRKGLRLEDKIVQNAEKQRTLSRKK